MTIGDYVGPTDVVNSPHNGLCFPCCHFSHRIIILVYIFSLYLLPVDGRTRPRILYILLTFFFFFYPVAPFKCPAKYGRSKNCLLNKTMKKVGSPRKESWFLESFVPLLQKTRLYV